MDKVECCGTCQYHKPDNTWPDDWICTNPESERCGDWTDYEDICECYEERRKRGGKKK